MTDTQIRQLITDSGLDAEGRNFRLAETHISWVLLSGGDAYKVKKPVKFDFLDFSTLEKRHHFCQRELELNSRFSQGVYLEVLPITRSVAGLAIGGEGEVIGHTLHMKRLEEGRQMNLLLEKGLVTNRHMQQLAEKLAVFHAYTDIIERPPDIDAMQADFADIESVADGLESLLGPSAKQRLLESTAFAKGCVEGLSGRLKERGLRGYIIDGHGDLHSRNIFLVNEPILFDCIEFNDRFRQVDVLDELAFLCMDLDYYGCRHLEAPLLNAYLKENDCITGDEDWAVFTYFKWYRANVKLKVNALRARQSTSGTRPAIRNAVEEYWQLYQAYYHQLLHEEMG
ncbi:MAG: hypothetical protein KDC66_16500 [Phaeodactylibacter sp.]|nr:hypothetical protein [Phaeodactylibacter sp.]MCB9272543.1 hypothetical protein [Lewinellaceae bacterium]